MMLIFICVVWFVVGYAFHVATLKAIGGDVTVGDCIIGLFAALLGPIMALYFLVYADIKFLKKKVF